MLKDRKRRWYHDPDITYSLTIRPAAICLIAAALIVGLFAATLGGVAFVGEKGCQARGQEYGIPSDYRFWAGVCFAEVDGQTVNMDNVRQNSQGVTVYLDK